MLKTAIGSNRHLLRGYETQAFTLWPGSATAVSRNSSDEEFDVMESSTKIERGARRTNRALDTIMNEALPADGAELAPIINSTPFLLTRCTRDLRYRFASQAYADMIGRSPTEIIGKPIREIMGAEGFQTILPHIEKVLEGESVNFEAEIPFPTVGYRFLQVSYAPETDERGTVQGWIASILDLTERKHAEEGARENKAQLEANLAALTSMHALSAKRLETAGIQVFLQEVMEAAVAMLKADKGTLQLLDSDSLKILAHHGHSQPFLDFFAAAENVASVCGAATRRGERVVVQDIEQSPLFLGTSSLPIMRDAGVRAVQSTPLVTRAGRLLGILTTQWRAPHLPDERDLWRLDLLARQASDLIESGQSDAALRDSEQRFRLAAQVSRFGVHDYDPVADVCIWTPELYALTGVPRGTRISHAYLEGLIHPDDRSHIVEELRAALDPRGTGGFAEEFRIVRPDNRQTRWIYQRAHTFFEGEGAQRKAIRSSGVVIDVTDRKRVEAQLREASDQLASRAVQLEKLVEERTTKLTEMINELQHVSYAIVHDMRAPLRAMNSFAGALQEYLNDAKAPAEPLDFCQRIITAASRLDKLIQDSLNYTKAVLQEVPLKPVNLSSLVHSIIETYPNLQPDKADISVEEALPIVMGEESLLTQCFSNLLGNAVKFVPPGTRPKILIRTKTTGALSRITVQDNGIGIPEQAQPRLFGMFQRLTSGYEGTGIGLAIVRKVVERMGGKVGADSEPGKGSRFWVELRCANLT